MSQDISKTECERCGTCCTKGGPALHFEDQKLLMQKFIERESLITIRRGEPVLSPDKNEPEWARTELTKLKGKQAEWTCVYYDPNSFSCSIYQHRPLECILLKCWNTAELKAIAGKRLLSRLDIISSHEPIFQYIQKHENECSLEILEQFHIQQNSKINKNNLAELTGLVNKDLAVRSEAVMHLNFNLDLELFYFGRPLFKILWQFGLLPREVDGKIILLQA